MIRPKCFGYNKFECVWQNYFKLFGYIVCNLDALMTAF